MSNPTDPLETEKILATVRYCLSLSEPLPIVKMIRYIESLASELSRVRAQLEMSQRETVRHRDAQFLAEREVNRLMGGLEQFERSIRSLIATIDRDNGERQEGETVAQSCERAGKVVAEMITRKETEHEKRID